MDLSLALSAIAILMSAAALYYTKRQLDASDQVVAIEKERRADELAEQAAKAATKVTAELALKQADLRVARVPRGLSSVDRIHVYNNGPAIAEHVLVAFGAVPEQQGQLPEFVERKSAMREYLAAGSSMELPYWAPAECAVRFKVNVHWKDASGSREAEEEILDIG